MQTLPVLQASEMAQEDVELEFHRKDVSEANGLIQAFANIDDQ